MKGFLKVLLTLAIIALCIFLLLFVCARVFEYDSIGSMVSHMLGQLNIMWRRIIG